jgi:hypothetical protein
VSNRGIGRGRMFMGSLVLVATVMNWAVGLMMSPHGEAVAKGTEHVRIPVVTVMRGSAVVTILLCSLSAWLLFPARRPKWPARDWALIALFVVLVGSSLYTLVWLQTSVLG